MPPPDAVAGRYKSPDGRVIKVAPLTDEDRFTIVRWIDLGCPIDRGEGGWFLDDNRPTLTLTSPHAGANAALDRILIGAHDDNTGLDAAAMTVTADFPVNGIAAGENLASKLQPLTQGVWELKLAEPINAVSSGTVVVAVKDKQGNETQITRTFSVNEKAAHLGAR